MTMNNLTTPPTTDPAIALRFRDRQFAAELIAVALLELDLFTWLDQTGGATRRRIEDHFGLKPRPTDVLLTLCRASGFVQTAGDVDGEGITTLTPTGREHLVATSPWFLGPYYKPIAGTPIYKDFLSVLQTGRPGNWQGKVEGADWHESMRDPAFAQDFTDLMNCRGTGFAQAIAREIAGEVSDCRRMLDVGGGSGIYSSVMVAAHPALHAMVLEQPPVDAIARREIARHRLTDRVEVVTADMFEQPWPGDIDLLLMSNLLHDWDLPQVDQLMARAAEAMVPGGLLILHGAILDADKTGPLPVAEYSALLSNITQGKCYSVAEYGRFCRDHGFGVIRHADTIGDRGVVVARRSS